MRIGVTEIHVDHHDKAGDVYTRVLGLQVKTGMAYCETPRRASADAVRRDRRRLRRRLREPPQPRPGLNRWTTSG
jgi:hypothetical protein